VPSRFGIDGFTGIGRQSGCSSALAGHQFPTGRSTSGVFAPDREAFLETT